MDDPIMVPHAAKEKEGVKDKDAKAPKEKEIKYPYEKIFRSIQVRTGAGVAYRCGGSIQVRGSFFCIFLTSLYLVISPLNPHRVFFSYK